MGEDGVSKVACIFCTYTRVFRGDLGFLPAYLHRSKLQKSEQLMLLLCKEHAAVRGGSRDATKLNQ